MRIVIAFFFLCTGALCPAQVTTGEIPSTVVDGQNAPIPGAKVRVIEEATGQRRDARHQRQRLLPGAQPCRAGKDFSEDQRWRVLAAAGQSLERLFRGAQRGHDQRGPRAHRAAGAETLLLISGTRVCRSPMAVVSLCYGRRN